MELKAFFRNWVLPVMMATVLVFLPVACEGLEQQEGNDEYEPIVLTKSQQEVAYQGDVFALDFIKTVAKSFPETNFFVSPMSLSMLTSMLANGAEGETYAEIVKAIGMDKFTVDQVNDCYTTLVSALLKADKSVSLSLANSIWAAQGLNVLSSFKKQMTSVYQADTYVVDFAKPSTLTTINEWCSKKTQGLVPKMFEDIDPQVMMILINALYFKGNWSVQFDPELTKKGYFTTLSGSTVQMDFVNATGDFAGACDDDAMYVRMPYGNGAFEMWAILPYGKDFYGYLDRISEHDLHRWKSATLRPQKIKLSFPKFKAEFDTDKQLVPIMQKLGMNKAFTSSAEFGKMSDAGLYVSDMRQKAFVSIDEKGTEAAAVTVAEMRKNASGVTTMAFDRPFLYLIREKSTGVILFAGVKVK